MTKAFDHPQQEIVRIIFDTIMTPWELVERVARVKSGSRIEVTFLPDHSALSSAVVVEYLGQAFAKQDGVTVVCGDTRVRLQLKRAGAAVRSGEREREQDKGAHNQFEEWAQGTNRMRQRRTHTFISKPYLVGAALCALIILFLFSAVLPRAVVTVVAQTREITRKEAGTVDARWRDVQDDPRHLRGHILREEGSVAVKIPITELSEGGAKARGTLTFENQTGNEAVVTPDMPLISEEGVSYEVDTVVTIPPAHVAEDNSVVFGTASAPAHASVAGEGGNRTSGKLVIASLPQARQTRVSAIMSTPFSGGARLIGRLVSETRVKEALPRAHEELTHTLEAALREAEEEAWWFIPELSSVTTTEVHVAPEVGAETDEMTLTLHGAIAATLVARDDVHRLFELQEHDCTRERCRLKAVGMRQQEAALGMGRGEFELVRTVTKGFQPQALKEKIAGKSLQDARHIILSTPGVQDVRIALHMSIRSYLPRSLSKIEVRIE